MPSDLPPAAWGRSLLAACAQVSAHTLALTTKCGLWPWASRMQARSHPSNSFPRSSLSHWTPPPPVLPRPECQGLPPLRMGPLDEVICPGLFRIACGGRTSPTGPESSALVWILTGTGGLASEVWQSGPGDRAGEGPVLGTSPHPQSTLTPNLQGNVVSSCK